MEQQPAFKRDDGNPPSNPIIPSDRTPSRSLKVEADGGRYDRAIKPKIRLRGNWLERAGFKPGSRVSIVCVASGFIELRSQEAA